MLDTRSTRFMPHVGATNPQYVTIVRGRVCAMHHDLGVLGITFK